MQTFRALIVNLYGGPGTGKSVMAARLFAELKLRGVDVELQEEHARRTILLDQRAALRCQPFLFGQQVFELQQRAQSTDVVVLDSPLLLNPIYDRDRSPALEQLVHEHVARFHNLDVILQRAADSHYSGSGRDHTLAESIELDGRIAAYVREHCPASQTIAVGDAGAFASLVDEIMQRVRTVRLGPLVDRAP